MPTPLEYTPTAEQVQALDLFRAGGSVAVEAGAGTGKTSTLRLMGATTDLRGQYVAFNRSIVNEAGSTMPANVVCSTAHSLAFRQVGRRYAHRLRSGRMRSGEIANHLKIDPVVIAYGERRKPLSASLLAGFTMRTVSRFCQSADPALHAYHPPFIEGIDLPDPDGRRVRGPNNRAVGEWLIKYAEKAWADLVDPDGTLPFRHEHYLKLWQLGEPFIPAAFIMFDEAQDASPVLLDVVARQADHAQLVFVGDSQQAIYEFTGAVNALAKVPASGRAFLTRSWRFGQAIADVANEVLERIPDAELRLTGNPTMGSIVDEVPQPDAVLCRTNATTIHHLIGGLTRGQAVHIIGGGDEVARFAKAVDELRDVGSTQYPDLACFSTWGEVQTYVADDPQGGDLKLLVKLVDDFGTDALRDAIARQVPEDRADLVVSTAHKAKGREWPTVKIGGDFPDDDRADDPGELRLSYVAVTRARRELDVTDHPLFADD